MTRRRPCAGIVCHREKIADPAVWADAARSQPLMRERKRLEALLSDEGELARRSEDIDAYFELAREGEPTEADLEREIPALVEYADRLESKPCCRRNRFAECHCGRAPGCRRNRKPGLGGNVMRMYIRWGERQRFKVELNEIQDGDEAGINRPRLPLRETTRSAC